MEQILNRRFFVLLRIEAKFVHFFLGVQFLVKKLIWFLILIFLKLFKNIKSNKN
jgi:hypothetical protein